MHHSIKIAQVARWSAVLMSILLAYVAQIGCIFGNDAVRAFNTYVDNGIQFAERNQYSQAMSAFAAAIRINPRNPRVYLCRGTTFRNSKNFDSAISDYTKAIALGANDAEASAMAYRCRGEIYLMQRKQFKLALEDFNKAVRLNGSDWDAFNKRGYTFGELGQYENAISDYNTALRLRPGDRNIQQGLAYIRGKLLAKTSVAASKENAGVDSFPSSISQNDGEESRRPAQTQLVSDDDPTSSNSRFAPASDGTNTIPKVTLGSERFAIKGLHLGALPSAVTSFLKETDLHTSESAHILTIKGEKSVQQRNYLDSQEYSNGKQGTAELSVTLKFTPPMPSPEGVVPIVYSIDYKAHYGDGVSKDELLSDLKKKYGQPDSVDFITSASWTVPGTNNDCSLQAYIRPSTQVGKPGEILLWAFDQPFARRARDWAAENLDRIDSLRPKDTTKPDF